jgi:hypothetical protein
LKEKGQTALPNELLAIQAIVLRWHWFYEAILAEESFLADLKDYLLSPTTGNITQAARFLPKSHLLLFLRDMGG